jgi:hypothetical protein
MVVVGARSAAVALAAGCAVLGVAACSGGEEGPGPGSRAAVLVDRLGCESGRFASGLGDEWFALDMRDCTEGPVVARVYGSLTADDHAEAVRSLIAG